MRFLENSILHFLALFACVALTAAAVICVDESSLNKTQAATGKVNERQWNATVVNGKDEAAEIGYDMHNNYTDVGAPANVSHHGQSQVTQFLQTVQDTLEKAKPWVVEIEKEAKRLEETAKRFGEGVIRGLGSFVDRLIGVGHGSVKPTSNSGISTTSPEYAENVDDKTPDFAATTTAATVAEVLTDIAAPSVADVAAVAAAANDAENEISGQQDDNALCPDGFVADVNGICLRNHN